jgi:hypothetical protein
MHFYQVLDIEKAEIQVKNLSLLYLEIIKDVKIIDRSTSTEMIRLYRN